MAEAADRQECLELIATLTGTQAQDGWAEAFDELVTGNRGVIVLAEEDGDVLGVATVSYNVAIRYGGEYCQLEELIVDEKARGKNLGALLMEAVVERARERGCAEMGLYLVDRTEANRPFYEKFGFEFVGSEMRQRLRSQ
jgi:GNAT superfamily N-acetyltransferase